MANRIPLIINSGSGQIQELAADDNLLLTSSDIVGVGNVTAVGNIAGSFFTGNGSLLTGITGGGTPSAIVSGTSNVNVVSSGGNVTVGVGGTGNVAVFATTGEYVTGLISASGNITGGNVSATNLTGSLATAAQANITSVGTLTSLSVTGNITGGNVNAASTRRRFMAVCSTHGSKFLVALVASALVAAVPTARGERRSNDHHRKQSANPCRARGGYTHAPRAGAG